MVSRSASDKQKRVDWREEKGIGEMRSVLALVMCVLFPVAVIAGDGGYKVTYDGGSIADVKSGSGVKLYIEGTRIRFTKDKTDLAVVPASAVTEISYGQDVHRRVGTAALGN